MRTVAVYLVALAAVFTVAFAVGSAVGPVGDQPEVHEVQHDHHS
jgi:hypothetical protein